jgi:hypothetical protein
MPPVDTKNVDVSSDLGDELDTDLDTEVKADEAKVEKAEAPKVEAKPDVDNGETPLKQSSGVSPEKKEISALRRLERQQGRDRALAKLNAVAKSKGYEDIDSLINSIKEPEAPPAEPKKPSEKAQMAEELGNYKALASKQEKIIRQLKDQLNDLKVSTSLERQAIDANVTDVDYAVSLLRRKAKDMSEEEAKAFSPKAYFDELKTSKPWLFKAQEAKPEPKKEPANTGPAKADKQAKADKVEKEESKDKDVDVRKMSRKEYQEYLAKNGLRDPRSLV